MKLYQLALDFDTYAERAGWWLVVSDNGKNELSKPFATKEEAQLEMGRIDPTYWDNLITIKLNNMGTGDFFYMGALATKASYSNAMNTHLQALFLSAKTNKTLNRAWVFKYEAGQFVLNVGQRTKQEAAKYLQKNSILVSYLEG